jgi:hypothetical protein
MSTYATLTLDIPGHIGQNAHAFVARCANSADLPPKIFNYSATTQSAIPAPPLVRFFGDGRRIRIMGVTDEGAGLVLDHAGDFARLLDPTARWRIERGDFSSRRRSEPQPYDVRSFVHDLTPGSYDELASALRARTYDDPLLVDYLKSRLAAGIIRQHETLGLPAPASVTFDYFRVLNNVPVRVKGARFFNATDLLFATPLELRGPWQLGSLQLRGYGRVLPVTTAEGAA